MRKIEGRFRSETGVPSRDHWDAIDNQRHRATYLFNWTPSQSVVQSVWAAKASAITCLSSAWASFLFASVICPRHFATHSLSWKVHEGRIQPILCAQTYLSGWGQDSLDIVISIYGEGMMRCKCQLYNKREILSVGILSRYKSSLMLVLEYSPLIVCGMMTILSFELFLNWSDSTWENRIRLPRKVLIYPAT